jgi:allantoinase
VRKNLERDFVGYGRYPPAPRWPGGARLAVNVVFNYEEGAEASFMDGDGRSDNVSELGPASIPGKRDLAAESRFEYGSRVGFWRLYRIFTERKAPFTVFGCAQALERNPEAAAAIVEAGADVCCHGWRWIQHFNMTADEERAQIARAIASLKTTIGERPLGWYCRYAPSENTRRLLVQEGGFLYDSDYYGDELPFWCEVDGTQHLVVPYSLNNNDGLVARGALATGAAFFEYLREGFDMLYAEGATAPKMMSVGLHMRVAGHPSRAAGVARFLDYVQSHDDVWLTGRVDIARHWRAQHPAP